MGEGYFGNNESFYFYFFRKSDRSRRTRTQTNITSPQSNSRNGIYVLQPKTRIQNTANF